MPVAGRQEFLERIEKAKRHIWGPDGKNGF